MITPKEKAIELIDKHRTTIRKVDVYGYLGYEDEVFFAKESALITVNAIISANPHSNPFNTAIHSTIKYWGEVKQEIELL